MHVGWLSCHSLVPLIHWGVGAILLPDVVAPSLNSVHGGSLVFLVGVFERLILVDALQNSVHLLLQKQLQFLFHELIDWTPLHEVCHQTVYSVTVVHHDPLEAEVGNIHIYEELRFLLTWGVFGLLWSVLLICFSLNGLRLLADQVFRLRLLSAEPIYSIIVGILHFVEETQWLLLL